MLDEKRAHPRIDLLAQVQVTQDSEVYIMSTANISRGGIFIQGNPAEFPELRQGSRVELVIFASEDIGVEDARLDARVVRVEDSGLEGRLPGFGLEFTSKHPDQLSALESLIDAVTET